MVVRIADLRPNPYRNIEHYPIDEDKVNDLMASIRSTGPWPNLYGRKHGDQIQIAYGHHRWMALKKLSRELGGEIHMAVDPLTDEMMLKIMVQENQDTWSHSVEIEIEGVAAVVGAYARGEIELKQPGRHATTVRFAPSFRQLPSDGREDDPGRRPYTSTGIANFLGWSEDRAKDALALLEAIELKRITRTSVRGITRNAAVEIIRVINAEIKESEAIAKKKEAQGKQEQADEIRAEAEVAAREAAAAAAEELKPVKKGKGAKTGAAKAAKKAAGKHKSKARRREKEGHIKPPPHIDEYAAKTCTMLAVVLRGSGLSKRLDNLAKFAGDIPDKQRRALVDNLDSVSRDAKKRADGFRFVAVKEKPAPRQLSSGTR